MFVIPAGKRPDKNNTSKKLKKKLEVKEDKYDLLSILCMHDELKFNCLKNSLQNSSYRDNSEEFWNNIEEFVDILEELEELGAIEIDDGHVSITDTGLQKWKKVTLKSDVDPNMYV